jgi:hypothetical protein
MAHIHRAPPGVNGPIVIGAPSFPLGSPITFTTTLSDPLETDPLAGLLYVNIHSSAFPPGEIRGQFVAIPKPSTFALAGAVLLGLAAWQRRNSRKVHAPLALATG